MMDNDIHLQLNQIIQTRRIQLIPQSALHAKEMFILLNDKSLYTFTAGNPPLSEEALEKRFKKLESRSSPDGTDYWLNWVIQNEDSALIGYVQATVSSESTDIAWLIGAKWQRKGYAYEAAFALLEWLRKNRVKRIRAYIHPEHQASQAVARRIGLVCQPDNVVDGEEIWELSD